MHPSIACVIEAHERLENAAAEFSAAVTDHFLRFSPGLSLLKRDLRFISLLVNSIKSEGVYERISEDNKDQGIVYE